MNNGVNASRAHATRNRGPIRWIYDLFSSVWLGITLMILIFLYMTIGSAGLLYPVGLNIFDGSNWVYELPRTWRWVDKTEMEFFSWWPFNLLMALFTINIIVVTLRRIRLTLLNSGVWAIHTGIVILTLSSVYYFGTKVEGDTPVFRRSIVIAAPGAQQPVRMVVRPQNFASVDTPTGLYQFSISDINPNWPLLSGDDEGKTTCSVNVNVQTPTRSFVRQLLMNYPQYTEDILPGKGRAVKVTGEKLVEPELAMTLELEPQTKFYLMSSAAIYVREVGASEWVERPIDGLPHYSDHIASTTEIWQPHGDPIIEPDPLNIVVQPADENDPIAKTSVRVVGRLRYSPRLDVRPVPGGQRLYPVLGVQLESQETRRSYELIAMHPQDWQAESGMLGFLWAQSPQEVDALAERVQDSLSIAIPESGVSIDVPLGETLADNPDLAFTPIEGSDWSYRLRGHERNLRLGPDNVISVAIVELKSPQSTITRWVADRAAATRDVSESQGMVAPDPVVQTRYSPGSTILIIGGPDETDLTLVAGDPQNRQPLTIGKTVSLSEDSVSLSVKATSLMARAQFERRPEVTPLRLRQKNAGEQLSRIKVLLENGKWQREVWLPYHRYPLASSQFAVPGRFPYAPTQVTLPDGRKIEMLFSRKSWPLPRALALEDFELQTHVGGYTGQTTSVRDFVSRLRYYDGDDWSDTFTASLNKPAEVAGKYLFQSEWDPGNMAYTGLGVGNRNGVYMQLIGTCISVAGMIFVFYIKPIIKRRRRMAVYAAVEAEKRERSAVPTGAAV